ncbi:MAG TPA: cytochrome c oxidase accessory protein CcoG [Flavobacteriales bacterium]|nr:cytochrome c oxidase accessory protein CcoG [Flavobacteriales bacterium]
MDSDPKRENPTHDESFRDSINTITADGKRNWIYPQRPKGKFYNRRTIVSIVYLILFFTIPFIKLDGDPLVLMNIVERKFIIFGLVFFPQDLFLFALAMLTFMVFIVLFTVIFGRLFCGWACPQTIFMEMVFRKIEYWIEGDANKQRQLDKGPWNLEKIRKKGSKTFIFFVLSFLFGNFFLSYIIGMDELISIVQEPLSKHYGGFSAMIFFTGAFFFVYMYFREQVCLVVCPYGRLQGVLLDRNSIMVAYDYVRGEPRGKHHKGDDTSKLGDCIDCGLCVRVCPTGIDIRNGTQLECVNCTACIDACDGIMEGIHKPKGLIRYDSENGIASGKKLTFTLRMIGYSIILVGLMVGLSFGIAGRSKVEATILRAPGMMFQEVGKDSISNLYNFKIVNKTKEEMKLDLILESPAGVIKHVGSKEKFNIPSAGLAEGTFFVTIARKDLEGRKNEIKFKLNVDGETLENTKTNFLGPVK